MSAFQPRIIDLFAGAGGFGLGFRLAGFKLLCSVEVDAWATETLRYNNPGTEIIEADIRDFQTSFEIRKAVKEVPHILIGGPPCQGFSIAGPAIKDPSDPRNSLFRDFARWVELLNPELFVIENVKGLLSKKTNDGISVIEIIKKEFQDLDYFVEVWRLNSADYGVPQFRERIFIVGNRVIAQPIGHPPITHLRKTSKVAMIMDSPKESNQLLAPALTIWDAISDLPSLAAGGGTEIQPYNGPPRNDYQQWARGRQSELYNHVAMNHTNRIIERFKHIRWKKSSSDVAANYGSKKRGSNGEDPGTVYYQNNRRLHPFQPSRTIPAYFYSSFIHPYQHRNLTAREAARIQSFPDNYRFLGKRTVVSQKLLRREGRSNECHLSQYNQIGNAIPPLLAKAIAANLRNWLAEQLGKSSVFRSGAK